jgi:hypothetical protein
VLLQPGTPLGAYTVLDFLGAGGMASVYRVQHATGTIHAAKILRQSGDAVARADLLRRFLAEGEIQARLRHPNLLPVHGLIEESARVGLVMALLEGEDLGARLGREGAQPPLRAVRWLQEVLSALSLVHDHDIVHRDLKPGNIFLERAGDGTERAVVMDFGLARLPGLSQTRTGVIIGSLCYLSPEQIQDNRAVDHRADLFSVGTLLFELLTGTQAFIAESEFAVMDRILAGSYPPITSINPDIPEPLCAVVRRALRPDPAERFPDAAAFSAALQEAIDAGAVPGQVSPRINNAQEALLRKTVRARLEKSLAKLSRRRGGIAGLPELPPITGLFALAGRLHAMPLAALKDADEALPALIGGARQALQDWEITASTRLEALRSARGTLQMVRLANQPAAIAAAVGPGLGRRPRWRRIAAARRDAVLAAEAAEVAAARALAAIPPIPAAHPLGGPPDAAPAGTALLHPPPPPPLWMAVVVGVVVGLLGAAALSLVL